MSELFDQLKTKLDRSVALTAALALFEWDAETLAPEEAADHTGKVIGILSEDYFKSLINPEVKSLLGRLEQEENYAKLTLEQKATIRELRRTYKQLASIPSKEYADFCELANKSSSVWAKAKKNDDFTLFEEYLKRIVDYKKQFASYRVTESSEGNPNALYDVLLSDFEPSLSTKELDEFFELIKEKLVPIIDQVKQKQDEIDDSFNTRTYEIEKQRKFCDFISLLGAKCPLQFGCLPSCCHYWLLKAR